MRYEDKVVMITGVGRGIGKSLARSFAEEGANLSLLELDPEKGQKTLEMVESLGACAELFVGDVSDAERVREMVSDTVEKWGTVDVLVNNAGIQAPKEPFLETSLQTWEKTLSVNLTGFYLMTREVAEVMKDDGGGCVVNICSICGKVFFQDNLPYDVSKGAVRSLTGAAALDLAQYDIRVNGVAPGCVDTELNEETLSDPGAEEEIASDIPLGRIAQPEDVSRAVLFLASPDAAYITGAIIPVDGGYTLK